MNHQHWLAELAGYLESQIPGNARSPSAPVIAPPPELVAGLFDRQRALNPPAAAWLARQRAGSARSAPPVQSLADVPAIPVAAFKASELTTVAPAERTVVFHSSGTTAHQPSRHFHSPATLALYELALLAWFKRRVLGDLPWVWQPLPPSPSDRLPMLSLTPSPAEAPHSSLAFMIGRLIGVLGAADSGWLGRVGPEGWELHGPPVIDRLSGAAAASRPVVVLGTAFNFVHLLEAMEGCEVRLQLPPGSRVMETGGYKGRSRAMPRAELHALITDRLGVPPDLIVTEYGMSELSSQAYDIDQSAVAHRTAALGKAPSSSRRLQFPPWCHARIVSPETRREVPLGEAGLLQVADLANVASVLAIQTEDLAVRHLDGFELLGRAAHAEPRGCSLLASAPSA